MNQVTPREGLKPGLVSVTFRSRPPEEVIALAVESGLKGIEWGGDVHVPVGLLEHASRVGEMTRSAGLEVVSFGSYYRSEDEDFRLVLETAKVLGAPNIRVWAGRLGSRKTEAHRRSQITSRLRNACDEAAAASMTLSAEYHADTLTDTLASACELVREVLRPNFKLYWQPFPERPHLKRIEELKMLLPYVSHVHVFQWTLSDGTQVRHPLSQGVSEWNDYLGLLAGNRFALLEFVKDDSPSSLRQDAITLQNCMSSFQ